MVGIAISAILLAGLSQFVAVVVHNLLNAQERMSVSQGQFTVNEILDDKLTGLESVLNDDDFSGSPLTANRLIAKSKTDEGQLPYVFIGKNNVTIMGQREDHIVFKDFFVFHDIEIAGSSILYGDPGVGLIKQAPGIVVIGASSGLEKNFAGFAKIANDYYVAIPLLDKVQKCSVGGNCADLDLGNDSEGNPHELNHPTDIEADGADIYISDSGNHRVLRVRNPDSSPLTTVLAEDLNFPTGLAYYNDGADGVLFIADTYNHEVKKVVLDGISEATSVIGDSSRLNHDVAVNYKLNLPTGLYVDQINNALYIANTGSDEILKLSDPGPLNMATVSFDPNDLTNIGLIKLTFENLTALGTDLEAVNQSPSLHVGAYENSGNEFLYKFYTKFYNMISNCSDTNGDGDCIEWKITFVRVYDDNLLSGDGISIDSSAHPSMQIIANAVPAGGKYKNDITAIYESSAGPYADPADGAYIILDNNTYASDELFFDLDLSAATGISDFNPVKIEIFTADVNQNPPYDSATPETFNLILRNGDGILGTSEDEIELILNDSDGVDFPTGIGAIVGGMDNFVILGNTGQAEEIQYDMSILPPAITAQNSIKLLLADDINSFDYTSRSSINSMIFTKDGDQLWLEFDVNLDEQTTQTYTIRK